jgi:hypothetical protein
VDLGGTGVDGAALRRWSLLCLPSAAQRREHQRRTGPDDGGDPLPERGLRRAGRDEIRGYSQQYDAPQFRWAEPSVADQNDERATVSVGVTMTTRDEKTAQQKLTFTVVKKTGWWVCEVAG